MQAASVRKFTPLIYALNTRGEVFCFANNTWNKVNALPKMPNQAARTVVAIAAGPSTIKDNSSTGQLYALDNTHSLFGMYGISEQTPTGNGEWKILNDPQSTPICGIAAGQFKLLAFLCSGSAWVWQKSYVATKNMADTVWRVDKDTDASSVAVRQDADNENNETLFHIGYHYRFLIWERGYNKILYKNPTDAGWTQAAGGLKYVYAGVQGSLMGVHKQGGIFAASQVSSNPTWINIGPPSLYQAAQLDPKDGVIIHHKDYGLFKLAMGVTTDADGNVMNEIWLSGIFVFPQKNKLLEFKAKSMLWHRANITTENKFGTEWQFVAQQTDGNEPGLIKEIAICSLDQTQEYLKELKEAEDAKAQQKALVEQKKAEAREAKQNKALAAQKAKQEAQKAAAQKAAERRAQDAARAAALKGARGVQEKERRKGQSN